MTITTRGWEAGYKRMWPDLVAECQDILHDERTPENKFWRFATRFVSCLIARGSETRAMVEALVPTLEAAIAALAHETERGRLSFTALDDVNVYGAIKSVGVDVPLATSTQLRDVVVSIQTSSSDQRRHSHWNRAFAGLALDIEVAYGGPAGFHRGEPVPFKPGATFDVSVYNFLRHLIGAVAHRATLADCEPAWHDLLRYYFELSTAWELDDSCLLWIAWTLQHRIAGQPVGTVADYLHESIYRVATPG